MVDPKCHFGVQNEISAVDSVLNYIGLVNGLLPVFLEVEEKVV